MNCSAQMQFVLVCVPLFGGVHRGALQCSRDHAPESHSYLSLGSGCIGDSALCVSILILGGADARRGDEFRPKWEACYVFLLQTIS
mgnify:CR=1 FL=1